MYELGILKIELQNHIDGLEISKSALPECWTEDDERHLSLMQRIMDFLEKLVVMEDDGK